jgi:hypothetical protein
MDSLTATRRVGSPVTHASSRCSSVNDERPTPLGPAFVAAIEAFEGVSLTG